VFKCNLFSWEEEAIAKYFPRPPARLLVGAAGGGREVLALAAMGYEVVAFEPSAPLAALMADRLPKGLNVMVYRAGYEDMPNLFPPRPGMRGGNLETWSGFEAAILGFGSYSHLRTEGARIRTLSSFARYVRGPILVSFHQSDTSKLPPNGGQTERLGRLLKIGPRDRFSVYIGFTHDVIGPELAAEARRSGLSVVDLKGDTRDPHAVLCPVEHASIIAKGISASRSNPTSMHR
jgi:hypothetical protein